VFSVPICLFFLFIVLTLFFFLFFFIFFIIIFTFSYQQNPVKQTLWCHNSACFGYKYPEAKLKVFHITIKATNPRLLQHTEGKGRFTHKSSSVGGKQLWS